MMKFRLTGFAAIFSIAVVVCGCAPSADQNAGIPVMTDGLDHGHDHGHAHGGHPETLAAALHELEETRDTVRDAFAKDDSEAAHGPLHDVGHLLGEVGELAEKAELSAEAKSTIKANVDTLMDSFGAVDKKMHSADGSEGSDYKDVAEKIDAAIAAMTTAAGPVLNEDEHAGHDHGDHDHKEGDHKEGDDDGEKDAK
jgi:Spy/CpxP family protein refolding chaperone